MAVRIYRNGQWNNITSPVATEDANRIAIGATDETIDPSKIYYPSFVDVNNPSNARDYEPLYTGAGITFAPGGVGNLGGGDLAICGNLHLKGTSGSHDGDIFSAGGSDGHFGIYNTSSGFLALSVLDANGTYLGISTFMVQDGNDNPGRKSYFDSNVSPVYHNCYNLGESSTHQWNNVYANKFYGDGSNLTCVGGATAWQPDAQENLYAGTLAGNAFDADTCCNIAVGYHAGCSTQSTGSNGDNNIFLGSRSGAKNTIGGNNVFLGQCAGYCNTNGVGSNVAIGRRAFYSNTTGSHNVAIGCRAGYNLGTGMYNIFLGRQAGHCQTSGDYNIAIGNRAQLECLTGQNQLVIASSESAYWLRGDCNSNVQLGAGLKDCDSCLGTSGQFLSSTGSHLKWQTVVSTSDNACKILTVDRPIACNTDHFLTFVDSNNSTAAFESLYTEDKIVYNPNTCTMGVENLYAHRCITAVCALCSNGNTILGDSSADNVTFNAKVGSSILPTACACSDSDPLGKDLGSTSFLWRNIYARKFVGQITGNADSATCVTITANNANTAYRVPFASAATGTVSLYSDSMTYTPNSNKLEVIKIKPTKILDTSDGTGTSDYVIKADGSGGWSWGLVDSGSVGTLNFTDLDDTPGNYTSSANKLVAVNSGASGLEFINASTVGTDTFVTGASFGSITGGARLTLTRNNSQPDLTADLTLSDTKYDLLVPSGSTAIRLEGVTESGNTNDDITITGGSNISVTRTSATELNIASSAEIDVTQLNLNRIRFGPGNAVNDDANIEWLGGSNAGYLRISTSDDNGTEYIELGDYGSVDVSGTFRQWMKLNRNELYMARAVRLNGELRDKDGDSGSNGQVLVSTGSKVNWVNSSTVGTDTFVTGASFGSITGGARLTLTRNNSQSDITADLTISTLGGVEQFTDLTDTPNNYSGDANKIVVVNGSANGLTFANPSTVGAQKFTDLTDTPGSIANPGDNGKVVKVSSGNLVFDTVSGLGGVTDVTVVQTGRSAPCALPITVTEPSTGTKQINIPSSSNAFGARFVQNSSPSNPCDGDIWFDTSTTAGGSFTTNRIIQGNTKAEVNDTNGNGHFLVETEGDERLRITHDGKIQIPDNVELQLGTGGATGNGDLRIFSNGSEQIIWDNGDGGLVLQTASSPIELRAIDQHGAGNNEIMLKANVGGTVDLYEDSTLRFQTTTNGVRIYGGLQDKDGDLGTSGQVLSSTGSELNWVDGAALPKTVTARALSAFVTSNSSYQTAVTATIDPVQTNSSILVIVSGSGRGAYGGTGSGQQATGAATVYKNNAPWTGIETILSKGNPLYRTPISQAILDNANHGGNSVSYQIMLRRQSGGVNVSISQGTSITLMEVTP